MLFRSEEGIEEVMGEGTGEAIVTEVMAVVVMMAVAVTMTRVVETTKLRVDNIFKPRHSFESLGFFIF